MANARTNLIDIADKIAKKNYKETKKSKFPNANELIKLATVDLSKATDNKDRLEMMLTIINNSIPIAEGLFRYRPSQSASYALSNLISQSQGLVEQLDDTVNHEELAEGLMTDVIKPIIESMILELGRTIRKELKNLSDEISVRNKKKVKLVVDSIYRKYGKITETKMEGLNKGLLDFLT